MIPISFADFFEACRHKLTDAQLRALHPRSAYYRLDGCWFGWHAKHDAIWLDIIVGDVRGLLRLKNLILGTGARYIGWQCRKGSPGYAWALYWKAELTDIGEKYPDGEIAWIAKLDMRQTRQVKKEMEAELAKV